MGPGLTTSNPVWKVPFARWGMLCSFVPVHVSPVHPMDWTTEYAANRDWRTVAGLPGAKHAGRTSTEGLEEFRAETVGPGERTAAEEKLAETRRSEDFPCEGMSSCRRKKGTGRTGWTGTAGGRSRTAAAGAGQRLWAVVYTERPVGPGAAGCRRRCCQS